MAGSNTSSPGGSHARHHHTVKDYNRAFAIGVGLNTLFVVVEAGYGIASGSLALIADAGHNLSDVLSLLLAWGASLLAAKAATERRTYGFRRVTIMASLISAVLLLIALGSIAWEAIGRISHPEPVAGLVVVVVAAIGVLINAATALLFVSGQKEDLNIRGAFLHMVADAGVSLGVVVGGLIILRQGWLWVDPVISLVIVAVIFISTLGLLRDSINHVIDAVPKSVDIKGIRAYLNGLENVTLIHDLHVWPLSTTEIALTVHLMVTDDRLSNEFLHRLERHLHDHFGIEHATIQVEKHDENIECMLDRGRCG